MNRKPRKEVGVRPPSARSYPTADGPSATVCWTNLLEAGCPTRVMGDSCPRLLSTRGAQYRGRQVVAALAPQPRPHSPQEPRKARNQPKLRGTQRPRSSLHQALQALPHPPPLLVSYSYLHAEFGLRQNSELQKVQRVQIKSLFNIKLMKETNGK